MQIKLKDWIEKIHEDSIVKVLHSGVIPKLLELSALSDWFNAMYGVDLEVYVKSVERRDNEFFSKEAADRLLK